MKIIKVLLEESQDFNKYTDALTHALASTYDGKYLDARTSFIRKSLAALTIALANKQIYNPDWQDIKGLLGIISQFRDKTVQYADKDREQEDRLYVKLYHFNDGRGIDELQLNNVKKVYATIKEVYDKAESNIKMSAGFKKSYGAFDDHKTDNINKANAEVLKPVVEMLKIGVDIAEALQMLKPHIIKGRKPAEPNPNVFSNKLGSKESQDLIRKALNKGITKALNSYETQMEEWISRTLDSLWKRKEIPQTKIAHYEQALMHQFEYELTGRPMSKDRTYLIKKKGPKYDSYPKEEAKKQRDLIEEKFMLKNAKKLSSIIDKKITQVKSIDHAAYKEPEIHNGSGTVQCEFTFNFNDGAKFTVINKIIINQSARGERFYQYPTTFHDVTMSDGSKLKNPSEEKMVKDFK